MKCQNCGKNEVSFSYSSNINGCVSQRHLCAQCAEETGYDIQSMLNPGRIFNMFLPVFNGQAGRAAASSGGFFPLFTPATEFSEESTLWKQLYAPTQENECGCGRIAPDLTESEIDHEMRKRRELNKIREQMRIAAENDDFERAIELREKIREMET